MRTKPKRVKNGPKTERNGGPNYDCVTVSIPKRIARAATRESKLQLRSMSSFVAIALQNEMIRARRRELAAL